MTTTVPHGVSPVGTAPFRYEALAEWERLPQGWRFVEAAAVATDSKDRVYVFNRGDHPVVVFDREGNFLSSWGEGTFVRAHGVFIGPDDSVYCVDDCDHTVRKYTPEGRLLLTLGLSGRPSDTGVDPKNYDYRTLRQAGPPFNHPTNLALSPAGEIYVADGYGNARVHKFSADGRLLFSWGDGGSGPGQFHLPHGIAVDREGIVYVADRENSRIQLFSPEGKFLSEWTDVARPCQMFFDREGFMFVAELGFRVGLRLVLNPPAPGATGGRVSVFDPKGRLQARWGGGEKPCAPGDFCAPHGIWVDSRGSVYVAEVVWTSGVNCGLFPPDCHTLQKFVPLGHRDGPPA